MLVLGISCGHNANVCLLTEQEVLLHYEKERFTRIKNDSGLVDDLILMALTDAGVTIDDVELVASSLPVWPERGITGRIVSGAPYTSVFVHSRHVVEVLGRRLPAIYVPHHLGHMAYTYLLSSFEDADIIAVDAFGNFTATAVGVGSGAKLNVSLDLHPGNIGSLWAMASLAIFDDILAAGKVMGLAPYGQPRFLQAMRDRYLEAVQGFVLPTDVWRDHASIPWLPREAMSGWSHPDVMDLASSIQGFTTEVMLGLVRSLSERTGRRQLCLSGGVALNGVANEAIISSGAYDEVFIPPAVNDGGLSLGFALYAVAEEVGQRPKCRDPRYLGRVYTKEAIDIVVSSARQKYRVQQLLEGELPEVVAMALLEGKTVALWYGRAESGPRALGHRSILSDPRPKDRQLYLNRYIKGREPFRPFGASILAEDIAQVCDMVGCSPFMLRVSGVPEHRRESIPAITHIDGTTRPQTLEPGDRVLGPLRNILESFSLRTGCPAVLNTSFNIKGEPLVESPADALRSFSNVPLDLLILNDWLIDKEQR
jgi:carbamoyltransferase